MSFDRFLKFLHEHDFEALTSYQTTAGKLVYIHIKCLQTCFEMFLKVSSNDYSNRHALTIEPYELGSLDIFALANNQVFDYYKRPDVPIALDPKRQMLDPKSMGRQLKRFSLLALETDYHFVILHKQYLFIQTQKSHLKTWTIARPNQNLRMFPIFSLSTFFQKYADIGQTIQEIHGRRNTAFLSAIHIQLMKLEQIEPLQSYRKRLESVQELNTQFEKYRRRFQDRLQTSLLQLTPLRLQIQEADQRLGKSVETDLQIQYTVNELKKQEETLSQNIISYRKVLSDILQEQDEFMLMSDQVFFNNLAMMEQILKNMKTWEHAYAFVLKS